MSTASQNNSDNQEIDLSQISKKIGGFFEDISTSIFKGILFLKRNILIIGGLFVLGVVLGIYLDKTSSAFNNQIVVSPNFGSNDYLYSKIELLNSKIEERDTVFLKGIGFQNASKISKIQIEPIVDIYKFIDNKAENFELIKLMAEDGEISKIVRDNMTSKNYPFHMINLSSSKRYPIDYQIKPLLNYLNDSEYFKLVQKQNKLNIENKMTQNDSIIKQIDGVLSNIISSKGNAKSSSLVYYNDNMQLNDIIKTKDALITEQGTHKLELVNLDKIVKDISIVSNIKNNKGANNKMKLILPVLFIFMFLGIRIFMSFYNKQLAKSKLQ